MTKLLPLKLNLFYRLTPETSSSGETVAIRIWSHWKQRLAVCLITTLITGSAFNFPIFTPHRLYSFQKWCQEPRGRERSFSAHLCLGSDTSCTDPGPGHSSGGGMLLLPLSQAPKDDGCFQGIKKTFKVRFQNLLFLIRLQHACIFETVV